MAPAPTFVAPSPPLPGPAHTTDADAIVEALESNVRLGLSESKAAELKNTYGLNQIKPPEKPSVRISSSSPSFRVLGVLSETAATDELTLLLPLALQPWKLLGRQIANAMT
jgi:hypothetical protein